MSHSALAHQSWHLIRFHYTGIRVLWLRTIYSMYLTSFEASASRYARLFVKKRRVGASILSCINYTPVFLVDTISSNRTRGRLHVWNKLEILKDKSYESKRSDVLPSSNWYVYNQHAYNYITHLLMLEHAYDKCTCSSPRTENKFDT